MSLFLFMAVYKSVHPSVSICLFDCVSVPYYLPPPSLSLSLQQHICVYVYIYIYIYIICVYIYLSDFSAVAVRNISSLSRATMT